MTANRSSAVVEQAFSPALGLRYDFPYRPPENAAGQVSRTLIAHGIHAAVTGEGMALIKISDWTAAAAAYSLNYGNHVR